MNYTVTSKGQITLPKALRDMIGLHAGSQVNIALLDKRTITIKAPLGAEEIRRAVGKPANDQPLTQKERQRIKDRGL